MTRNQLEYWSLQETKRANRAKESETYRSNLAKETETHRSNRANELETARSNVARETENQRTNAENERIKRYQLQETVTHNRHTEKQQRNELAETIRNNKAREVETNRSNLANEAREGTRLLEYNRSNKANEALKQIDQQIALADQTVRQIINNEQLQQRSSEQLTDFFSSLIRSLSGLATGYGSYEVGMGRNEILKETQR